MAILYQKPNDDHRLLRDQYPIDLDQYTTISSRHRRHHHRATKWPRKGRPWLWSELKRERKSRALPTRAGQAPPLSQQTTNITQTTNKKLIIAWELYIGSGTERILRPWRPQKLTLRSTPRTKRCFASTSSSSTKPKCWTSSKRILTTNPTATRTRSTTRAGRTRTYLSFARLSRVSWTCQPYAWRESGGTADFYGSYATRESHGGSSGSVISFRWSQNSCCCFLCTRKSAFTALRARLVKLLLRTTR